jgi:hypothetical protein
MVEGCPCAEYRPAIAYRWWTKAWFATLVAFATGLVTVIVLTVVLVDPSAPDSSLQGRIRYAGLGVAALAGLIGRALQARAVSRGAGVKSYGLDRSDAR